MGGSTGAATDRYQYTYDRDGNRLTRNNSPNSNFNETFTYDNLNQLTNYVRGGFSQSWSPDALGNFNSVTTGGVTQTRSHNAQNEITAVSGATTPTYDANGSLTGDQAGRQFVYDAWNRLVTVKDSSGNTLETFTYDGQGWRVTATAGGTTTDLYYSSAWQVLEERVAGAATAQYVWSPVFADALILRQTPTAPLINDTFTAGDGTPLTSLGWTAAVGSFLVQGNRAVPLSGASNDQAVRDAGAADIIISCDVTPTGTWPNERDPDLLVRWSDPTHYWLLHLTAGVGVIQLYENAGSGLTLRVNQGYAFTSGNSYHVTMAAIGTTISVSINGVLQFGYSGAVSNRNATGVGLWLGISGSTTPCSWDNFQVTVLPRLWVQQDANWDVTAVADNTGAVAERYVYSPYGNVSAFDASWNVRSGGSAVGWVYLHQGLRYDPALVTYDSRGRAYHPDLMRFLQNDPLGFAAGDVDLYSAEGNNPTDRVDPSGMADWETILGGANPGFANDARRMFGSYFESVQGYVRQAAQFNEDFWGGIELQRKDPIGSVWKMGQIAGEELEGFEQRRQDFNERLADSVARLAIDPVQAWEDSDLKRGFVEYANDPPYYTGKALAFLHLWAGCEGAGNMLMEGAGALVETGPRVGGLMSGGYRGTGLAQAEVDAITADFRAAGGVVDQSLDAQRYLQARGAGGLTLNHETILLPANPTRTAVFEELVHAEQFRRGATIEAGKGGVLRFEAEAAETLIQNRHAWQLPPDEVHQVIDNLRNIRAELERLGRGQ
jgi:RHS repeat-associated protein